MKHLSYLVRITLLAMLLTSAALSGRPMTPAQAQGITLMVNTTADNTDDDNACSLREAICRV